MNLKQNTILTANDAKMRQGFNTKKINLFYFYPSLPFSLSLIWRFNYLPFSGIKIVFV